MNIIIIAIFLFFLSSSFASCSAAVVEWAGGCMWWYLVFVGLKILFDVGVKVMEDKKAGKAIDLGEVAIKTIKKELINFLIMAFIAYKLVSADKWLPEVRKSGISYLEQMWGEGVGKVKEYAPDLTKGRGDDPFTPPQYHSIKECSTRSGWINISFKNDYFLEKFQKGKVVNLFITMDAGSEQSPSFCNIRPYCKDEKCVGEGMTVDFFSVNHALSAITDSLESAITAPERVVVSNKNTIRILADGVEGSDRWDESYQLYVGFPKNIKGNYMEKVGLTVSCNKGRSWSPIEGIYDPFAESYRVCSARNQPLYDKAVKRCKKEVSKNLKNFSEFSTLPEAEKACEERLLPEYEAEQPPWAKQRGPVPYMGMKDAPEPKIK